MAYQPKVLIMDDEPDILDAMALILDDFGYGVKTSTTGSNVFEMVDVFQPDVVLIDVLMAGQDGRDICKTLKASDQTKNLPVIMVSAHPTVKESVFAAGADDFVAKPFDIHDLVETIQKHTTNKSPVED